MLNRFNIDLNFLRSLFLIILSIVLFFSSVVMSLSVYNNVVNPRVIIDGGIINYYKIVNQGETYPNIKIVTASKPAVEKIEISQSDIKVSYLGAVNNYDSFKILDCNKVPNCNLNLVIKLERLSTQLVQNKNYLMSVSISPSFQIVNKGIKSMD